MTIETATLGGGCFWCLEAVYLDLDGVTAVESGYAGGDVPDPSYEQVCGGETGHAEVVRVSFDTGRIGYREILQVFFAIHDPTTPDRQGNDVGTQYRSALYPPAEDLERCAARLADYGARLAARGLGPITTELRAGGPPDAFFYYAEPEHQQYLHKNPGGYCGLRGTGVRCAG
jgi:peptide-methionine (S)-S-oxide reductase